MSTLLETLKEALSEFTFLSPKDLLHLVSIVKIKRVAKGEHVIREGQITYDTIKVINGLFRHYVIDSKGVEKTLRFAAEGGQIGSFDTIFYDMPCNENIEALENSYIIIFDERVVRKLGYDSHNVLKLINHTFKQIIISNVEHIKLLNLLTPEERYDYFCKKYPELEQRIKQKYLASFLGITPTSLSRMRARMTKNK